MMHHLQVNDNEILRRVRERMTKEHLSQRELARRVGVSQGHLSKVFRSGFGPRARLQRRLAEWVASPETEPEAGLSPELARAVRRAIGGSKEAMHLITEVMHLLSALRRMP